MMKQTQGKKKTTSEIICQNFKLQPETIFQDYKCSLRASVTFFGRLYIGQEHFLFISNMFGIVKKCIISIDKVAKVESQNPAGTLILVVEKSDDKQNKENTEIQYLFSGFKSSNAEKLMTALWKRQKIAGDFLKAQEEQIDQEIISPTTLPQQKHDSREFKLAEGKVEGTFYHPQTVQNQKMKLVEVVLPCSVDKFYQFFVADKATVYPRRKHMELKGSEKIVITDWKQSKQLNSEVREINMVIKVVGVPFKSTGNLSQVCQLKKDQNYKQTGFEMNIITQLADIPYATYFNCEEQLIVKPINPNKCSMNVTVSIVFNKSTYMKGTILKRTYADMKEDYEIWVRNVNDIFTKMMKRQDASSIPIQKKDSSELQLSQANNSKKLEKTRSSNAKIQYEPIIPISQRAIDNINPLPKANQVKPSPVETQGQIMKLTKKVNLLTYLSISILVICLLQLGMLFKQ